MPAYPGERAANLEAQDDVTRRALRRRVENAIQRNVFNPSAASGELERDSTASEVGGAGLEPATLGM